MYLFFARVHIFYVEGMYYTRTQAHEHFKRKCNEHQLYNTFHGELYLANMNKNMADSRYNEFITGAVNKKVILEE